MLHLIILRVSLYFLQYQFNLFQLEVDDVIHDALSQLHMLLEQLKIEICIFSEWVHHVRVQVDSQQTAGVIRAQRNLTTRVGSYCAESQVCIAIRNRFTQNGVPEQYARLCRLPCIVYNLLPQVAGNNFFLHFGVITINRILLNVRLAINSCLHECIVNFYRNIGSCNFSFSHLGIDECLCIRVFDSHRQHQGATSSVLCHLSGGVGVALHKRHESCRCQG